MASEHKARILVYGGSSCLFSVNPERLLKDHNLPCVNLGSGAAMGASILTQAAFEEARAGDIVIVALEPALLTGDMAVPALGVQLGVSQSRWKWFLEPEIGTNSVPLASALLMLRPGGSHMPIMLAKLIQGKPLYRYQESDITICGTAKTPLKLPLSRPAHHSGRLSPEAKELLGSIRTWGERHQVRVAYAIPWSYVSESDFRSFQGHNARFLSQVATVLPTLKDPRLGAYTFKEHFADTPQHLNSAGADLRSDELAKQIKDWIFWTLPELQAASTQ